MSEPKIPNRIPGQRGSSILAHLGRAPQWRACYVSFSIGSNFDLTRCFIGRKGAECSGPQFCRDHDGTLSPYKQPAGGISAGLKTKAKLFLREMERKKWLNRA